MAAEQIPGEEWVTVTIFMPDTMHADLEQRAHARSMVVTELMRRAVALDRVVQDHVERGADVIMREPGQPDKILLYR